MVDDRDKSDVGAFLIVAEVSSVTTALYLPPAHTPTNIHLSIL